MHQERISVHHIGGRNGSRAFPILKGFEKDIINILYDADTDCLEHIRDKNQYLKSELHILPYGFGDACKEASLNINYDPFTSSLYDKNPDYNSYYSFSGDYDYIWAEVGRTLEKRKVNLVTMDHIITSDETPIPAPDFLSIDTQGSEYEILQGAEEALKTNILALVLEAEFHPIYIGQKLFGDLTKFLSDKGFHFVKFLNLQEQSPFRSPIGLRGEGFCTVCDALFLKRIDRLNNIDNADLRFLSLRKLAFIALVFNQFEYAVECLRLSKEARGYKPDMDRKANYFGLLDEIEHQMENMSKVYPETFVSRYPSFAASKSRFEIPSEKQLADSAVHLRMIHNIKRAVKSTPRLYSVLRFFKSIFDIYLLKGIPHLKMAAGGYSTLEKVLIRYGLKEQAKLLRKNRIRQAN